MFCVWILHFLTVYWSANSSDTAESYLYRASPWSKPDLSKSNLICCNLIHWYTDKPPTTDRILSKSQSSENALFPTLLRHKIDISNAMKWFSLNTDRITTKLPTFPVKSNRIRKPLISRYIFVEWFNSFYRDYLPDPVYPAQLISLPSRLM